MPATLMFSIYWMARGSSFSAGAAETSEDGERTTEDGTAAGGELGARNGDTLGSEPVGAGDG